jgi:hypothetical protein
MMKRNVTEIFQQYRLSLRDVWNAHFWRLPALRTWDSVEQFERLKPHLFQALVVSRLEEGCCAVSHGTAEFCVVPCVPDENGSAVATHVIVLNQEKSGYSWDQEILTLSALEATLRFVDFFEWSMMAYVDLRYYLVEITSFASRTDLLGRRALVDVHQADVFTREGPAGD